MTSNWLATCRLGSKKDSNHAISRGHVIQGSRHEESSLSSKICRLHLVRHGEAAANWRVSLDPGLSERGKAEADAAAKALSSSQPMELLTSPLLRARETATPLERDWKLAARVEPAVREVPSQDITIQDRQAWLDALLTGNWREQDETLRSWRRDLIDFLVTRRQDCVIFTHFVAINAAVGRTMEDDRVTVFRPANASLTILETNGETLSLVTLGQEMESRVN